MSRSADEIVYGLKREYLEKISNGGIRIDGRKFDEFRNIRINTNFVTRAEGSADVRVPLNPFCMATIFPASSVAIDILVVATSSSSRLGSTNRFEPIFI